MNYQSRIWIKAKNQAISVSRKNGKLHVTNPSGNHGFLMVPQLHDQSGKKAILVKFFGRSLRGDAPVFQLLDLKRTILSEVSFNSEAVIPAKYPQFFFSIKVPANAEFELDVIDVVFSDKEQKPYEDLLTSGNRTLIIAPSLSHTMKNGVQSMSARAFSSSRVMSKVTSSRLPMQDLCMYW